MARIRKEVMIDGVEYSLCQISPTKASIIFLKLAKILGPALGKAFGKNDISLSNAKVLSTDLVKMPMDEIIGKIADNFDVDMVMDICRQLLVQTYPVKTPQRTLGNEINFDAHLDDNNMGILHIGKLMKEVLVLQYADFFEGLGSQGNVEVEKAPTDYPPVP